MSIFLIELLALLVATLIFIIAAGVIAIVNSDYIIDDNVAVKATAIAAAVCVFLWLIFIQIGVGINTECHEIWIAKYEAQKATIEASIESENLSGLERIELVNLASELNGELASRRTDVNFWHHVTFGDIEARYNNLEPIQIK